MYCIVCSRRWQKSYYIGTWDFLAVNHYTTYFAYESEEGVSIIPDSNICVTQDENYPIGASFWLQVSEQ
jgi:hypothetical protein